MSQQIKTQPATEAGRIARPDSHVCLLKGGLLF
jgi:hypothetical protein